jgi:hypothetical protein
MRQRDLAPLGDLAEKRGPQTVPGPKLLPRGRTVRPRSLVWVIVLVQLGLCSSLPDQLIAVAEQNARAAQPPAAKENKGKRVRDAVTPVRPRLSARSPGRLDTPDMPRKRAAFRLLQDRDEKGKVPAPDARARAVNALKQRMTNLRRLAPARLESMWDQAGLGSTNWVWLGPKNVGGRTRSLLIHPTTPESMWLGSVGGGIWKSNDSGASWLPVKDFLPSLAISCMVMDPKNPTHLYAGTGEVFAIDLDSEGQEFSRDGLRGAGILRSLDGGVNWPQIPSTAPSKRPGAPPASPGPQGDEFFYVNRLAITRSGDALLAATVKGVFVFNDPAAADPKWVQALDGDSPGKKSPLARRIADVKFDPRDDQHAVAGGLEDGTAFWSDDGGRSWHLASFPASTWDQLSSVRVELACALARKTDTLATVYASVNANGGEIWRSDDGGKSYTKRNSVMLDDSSPANYLGIQGYYDNVIWAGDPADPNFVIVGGNDLWKSNDGGNTLVDISDWRNGADTDYTLPYSIHADHHLIVSHPKFDGSTNKTVYFGNDGGLYSTDDVYNAGTDPFRTQGWRALNSGYGATQFYSGAGNPKTGALIGGAQDNGTLIYTPNDQRWTLLYGGDGGYCAVDPEGAEAGLFYGEYTYLKIFRRVGGTLDWVHVATREDSGNGLLASKIFQTDYFLTQSIYLNQSNNTDGQQAFASFTNQRVYQLTQELTSSLGRVAVSTQKGQPITSLGLFLRNRFLRSENPQSMVGGLNSAIPPVGTKPESAQIYSEVALGAINGAKAAALNAVGSLSSGAYTGSKHAYAK